MRLKLDENMPMLLVTSLPQAGHDVHTAGDEGLLGKADEDVWDAVTREKRLLLTLDRDFGRLATKTVGHAGAIVLRPREANQSTITALAGSALAVVTDIDSTNRVAIVEDERIRIRPPLAVITFQEPT